MVDQRIPVSTGNKNRVVLPNCVVIYAKDAYSDVWANDFVRANPYSRTKIEMPLSASPTRALAVIDQATKLIAKGGILVFLVGHGGIDTDPRRPDPKVGTVELSEGGTATLGGYRNTNAFVDVFYDVNVEGKPSVSDMDNDKVMRATSAGAKRRLDAWDVYTRIGGVIRSAAMYRIIFLTCRVGQASDFIKKIAIDWNTVIEAPTRRLVLAPQPNKRVRLYLQGDADGVGTNIPESETNIPLLTDSNSYRAGPPYAPTTT